LGELYSHGAEFLGTLKGNTEGNHFTISGRTHEEKG